MSSTIAQDGTTSIDFAGIDRTIEALHASAVEREKERILPAAEVRALLDAGVGAFRVPTDLGGGGGSVRDLAELLIRLAAADSNITQVLRGHLGFVEILRLIPASETRTRLLRHAGAGEFFGPAASERGGAGPLDLKTRLIEEDGRLVLEGEKFYTTGSLFADWINVLVPHEGAFVEVVVPRDAPGITVIDDWAGFGQRLSTSGTTRFEQVAVDPADIVAHSDPAISEYAQAFYQLVHSATQAGIARRLADDLADTVRRRTRTYPSAPGGVPPQSDAQVLQVLGEVSSGAFSAAANVRAAAEALDRWASVPLEERAVDAFELAVTASASVQVNNTRLLGELTWRFFDATSASTVATDLALDRHWRNARTVSSHNPAVYKARIIGEYLVNGTVSHSGLSEPAVATGR